MLTSVLPWLAIGGLLYLMAQNAGKVKAASVPASSSAAGCTSVCGFNVKNPCSWCG